MTSGRPSLPPPPRRKRRNPQLPVIVLLAFLLAAGLVIVLVRSPDEPEPSEALEPFLADWSAGRDRAAARHTDVPKVAAAALVANRAGLDGAKLSTETLDVSEDGDRARAIVRLRWNVPAIGPYAYDVRVPLRKRNDEWRVQWRVTVVHPKLRGKERLGTTRDLPTRGPIRDRHGRAIVQLRPVKRVGAVVSEVSSPSATATGLARVLGVDAGPILTQLQGGGPEQFVEAIVLREDAYAPLARRIASIPDVIVLDDTAPIAPTREFARAVLGTVAPATAAQLEQLGSHYAPGDEVGQWGLQARFERRLAGTPDRRIVMRDATGRAFETLFERDGRPGRGVRTTLDRRVQIAAEQALGGRTDEAALVAMDASSGNLVAVANRPTESSFNRAMEGRYAPGSTFKVVTTAALLRTGLRTSQTVPCPATVTVQGRSFRNFEGSAAGAVPFSQDFAESCNTAFITLANRLSQRALTSAGRDYGLGRSLNGLPLTAPKAQVPPPRSPVERAAAMIGQHEILASPMSMAGVAATVAAGRWHAPRLLRDDRRRAGPRLPRGERATLARLMRLVVTSGTGTALAGIPGGPAGKSGTAEYGTGNPPPTHAWFIAYRRGIAVAVLVENGRAGGAVAAPIAAAFFQALDRRS
ncbi:MAG TPA: penicillin-binding transpeptidase domain-containing protein [Thermoleophilaceae bacterium]|nr:penicillin-binding transpeptidase domain-containing protein [Thermoleophilaceae bacterium]